MDLPFSSLMRELHRPMVCGRTSDPENPVSMGIFQMRRVGMKRCSVLISRTAATHVIALASHKRAIPTGKEVNDRSHFFRFSSALHRNARNHIGDLLRSELL